MAIILSVLFLLLLAGVIEYRAHQYYLRQIPLRIHVNGTRGKSSTTRLIAGALREAGYQVIAKTTGTTPRLILENGEERAIIRKRPVTILEQLMVVRFAVKRGANALVTECMGVNPEVQWTLEHRMIQSSIGVLTNVREDHLDEMGPDLKSIAKTLSLTIPLKGKLVTAEDQFFSIFQEQAQRLGTSIHYADSKQISKEELTAFPYVVFAENVACALEVCELLHVERSVALQGMYKVQPDPGAFKIWRLNQDQQPVYFINALAANDLQSTRLSWGVWQAWERSFLADRPFTVGVFNNRGDRGFRIREMAQFAKERDIFDHLFILGEAQALVKRSFVREGIERNTIGTFRSAFTPEAFLKKTRYLAGNKPIILFAFGNIKGDGWILIDYFERNGEELAC